LERRKARREREREVDGGGRAGRRGACVGGRDGAGTRACLILSTVPRCAGNSRPFLPAFLFFPSPSCALIFFVRPSPAQASASATPGLSFHLFDVPPRTTLTPEITEEKKHSKRRKKDERERESAESESFYPPKMGRSIDRSIDLSMYRATRETRGGERSPEIGSVHPRASACVRAALAAAAERVCVCVRVVR